MERICIDTLHSLFYGYPSMGGTRFFKSHAGGCIRPYAQTNQQNRYPASTAISVNGTPMRRNSDVLTS